MQVKIEVSGRHIHLSKEDFEVLFDGEGLNKLKDLSQTDEFSAQETVKIIGPKNTIAKVRVVGPFRRQSQLELSRTDCRNLGIDAPLKLSGDYPGHTITIATDKYKIDRDCAIVAKRHLHVSLEDAKELGLNHKDAVSISIDSDRSTVFKDVVVRAEEGFNKCVHLDTDEANAAGVTEGMSGELIIE